MQLSSKLLNLDRISSDFHYNADKVILGYIDSMKSNTLHLNETLPWNATNSLKFLIVYFYDDNYVNTNPLITKAGYHVIFHSNFEFPYNNEKNHLYIKDETYTTIDIDPTVYEADETLMDLNPKQ